MSYQVLARKYRPASFDKLEGQEHVLRALVNSLEQNRLHHAYLFTGTRGVGKTTIARILAKCFNCETGVTATPCGVCGSCVEIAEGRSVDLIEVDAASRTKVEDTRDLLDNVQYMPSANRFKVYLIDEVHMLSNHSFNALLKTLEEPPAHVKFLLATTDPKKLPVTVLSRCLQFNLKNLTPERVVNYLKQILKDEHIEYEEPALWHLGRAADGSMRDALSLTDQAISFCENRLTEVDVRTMLGAIDQLAVYGVLDALVERDAEALLTRIAGLAEFGPDYEMLLGALLSLLHRIAVAQAVPTAVDNSQGDRERVLALAKRLSREEVQLYYQIGLIGQRDLPLAPMPRDGFEMVMLRMLSFTPDQLEPVAADSQPSGATDPNPGQRTSQASSILSSINSNSRASAKVAPPQKTAPAATQTPASQAAMPRAVTQAVARSAAAPQITVSQTSADTDEIPWGDSGTTSSSKMVEVRPVSEVTEPTVVVPSVAPVDPEQKPGQSVTVADWESLFLALKLSGVTKTLAANCGMAGMDSDHIVLHLGEQHASLLNATHESRIAQALTRQLGRKISLTIEITRDDAETPAKAQERREQDKRARAVDAIESDVNVRQIIEAFDGKLDKATIMPRS